MEPTPSAADAAFRPRRILLVDNYDSFTFNLAQALGALGASVQVRRNDAFTLDDVAAWEPDGIVISPGPGSPDDAGRSNDVIRRFGADVPTLGVCLGQQCIAAVFGGVIRRAPSLLHGKTSPIHHDGTGIFTGLPDPFTATRYHSLVVAADRVPACLEVSARTADGLVMGVRHRDAPIVGVQFHPESILTTVGADLLANWVARLEPAVVA